MPRPTVARYVRQEEFVAPLMAEWELGEWMREYKAKEAGVPFVPESYEDHVATARRFHDRASRMFVPERRRQRSERELKEFVARAAREEAERFGVPYVPENTEGSYGRR